MVMKYEEKKNNVIRNYEKLRKNINIKYCVIYKVWENKRKTPEKIECLEATKRRKTIGRGINKKKITITEEEVNNYQEIHHRMYLKFIIK